MELPLDPWREAPPCAAASYASLSGGSQDCLMQRSLALLEEFLELAEEPALAIEDLLQALLAARAAF